MKVEASYSGIKKSLVEAISDPKRRRAESQIREPPDRIVLVEGRLDRFFFQENCEIDGLSFQTLGKGNGKREVIARVLGQADYYGIVDMDHDVKSTEIRGSKRLTDTWGQCCLYAFISKRGTEKWEIFEDARYVIRNLSNRDRRVLFRLREINSKLEISKESFTNYVRERTMARLWRGNEWKSGRNLVPEKGLVHSWGDIDGASPTRDWVSDLVDKPIEYNNWKKHVGIIHKHDLGVSDHDLAAGILILLRSEGIGCEDYPKYSSMVNREIMKLVSKRGDKETTNYFLRKLKLL